MKPAITDTATKPSSLGRRLLWLVAIWGMSVLVVGALAYLIRLVLRQ